MNIKLNKKELFFLRNLITDTIELNENSNQDLDEEDFISLNNETVLLETLLKKLN